MQPQQYQQPVIPQQNTQFNKRLGIIVLVAGVVMSLFIILAVILSGSGPSKNPALVAAQFSEIARISDNARLEQTASPSTRALAGTVAVSTKSSLLFIARIPGGAPSAEAQALIADSSEAELADAADNNEFNEVFAEYIEREYEEAQVYLLALQKEELSASSQEIVTALLEDVDAVLSTF